MYNVYLLLFVGSSNILNIFVTNTATLRTEQYSSSVVVDITPPGDGQVFCPEYISEKKLECSWAGFVDIESGIERYTFAIGTQLGGNDVFFKDDVPAYGDALIVEEFGIEPLKPEQTFFVTMQAFNKVGLSTTAFSDEILVDKSPPIPGHVIEVSDVARIGSNEHQDSLAGSPENICADEENGADCQAQDAICQTSLTTVVVAWQPFTELESYITR
ncbi:uncharacterized protein [Antedon mediterranea]|uniref:uncharacterized protein n=1 Tax=Antedon mediterranea TaxID=105859 RepID=UPI003AF96C9D